MTTKGDRRKDKDIEYLSQHWKKTPCVIRKRHIYDRCQDYHKRGSAGSLDRRRTNIDLLPIFCTIPNCEEESCQYCHTQTELHYHRDLICTGICPNDWSHNRAIEYGITLNECKFKQNCPLTHCVPKVDSDVLSHKVFHPLWLIRCLIENALDIYQEGIYKIGRTEQFKSTYANHKLIHQGMKSRIKDIEEEISISFSHDDDINYILRTRLTIIEYCHHHDVDEDIVNEMLKIFEFVGKLYS